MVASFYGCLLDFSIGASVAACSMCPTIFSCGWVFVTLVSILFVEYASSSVAIALVVFTIVIVGVVDLIFECVFCLN